MQFYIRSAICCLTVFVTCAAAHCQDDAKPRQTPASQESAHVDPMVRSYFEDSTIAAAHIDLSKVDVPAAVDWLDKQVGAGLAEQATTAKVVGSTLVRSLLDAGLSHVYATLSTLDAARGGAAVLLPCRDVASVKLLVETAIAQGPKQLDFQVFTSDGLVVVAQPATWQRISRQPDAGREPLLAALAAGLRHAIAVSVNLPADLRQEIAEIWPSQVPRAWSLELSPKQLMSDVASVTLTAELPPEPSFSATVAAVSAEANQRTRAALDRVAAKLELPSGSLAVTSDQHMLKVAFDQALLVGSLPQLLGPPRRAAAEAMGMNQLKQIMLAMHNFYDAYQFLPPRETRSKADVPLLSWRVHILPYLDQKPLYDQFHLDEPWDSPHNSKLIPQMPALYAADGDEAKTGKTRFVLPMLEGGAWYGDGPPVTFKQITDGTSNTIAVVIGPKDKAVVWTKPEELPLTSGKLVEELFGDSDDLRAAFFDGSVRHLPRSTDPKTVAATITMSGGEVVPNE